MSDLGDIAEALLQPFVIILLGLIFGWTKLIDAREVASLSKFLGLVCLPSALINAMISLPLDGVDWNAVLAVFIGKCSIFVLTAGVTLVFDRSPRAMARAGLFGIFVTQSNDIAMGIPIVHSLFRTDYEKMEALVYLAAPISLLFLTPTGFLMMAYGRRQAEEKEREANIMNDPLTARESGDSNSGEVQLADQPLEPRHSQSLQFRAVNATTNLAKSDHVDEGRRESQSTAKSSTASSQHHGRRKQTAKRGPSKQTAFGVVLSVVLNPVVWVVFVGLLLNLTVGDRFPLFLTRFFGMLGSPYTPGALFLVGLEAAKVRVIDLKETRMGAVLLLTLAKLVLLGILMKHVMFSLVHCPTTSDFGYIYGSLPTAPTVVLFAQQFLWESEVQKITNAVVFCLGASLPVLFLSAFVLKTDSQDVSVIADYSKIVSQDVGLFSFLASLFLIGMSFYLWKNKNTTFPIGYILNFALSQGSLSTFNFFCNMYTEGAGCSARSVLFFGFDTALLASRTWPAIAAFNLYQKYDKDVPIDCSITWSKLMLGWGVPMAVALSMIALGSDSGGMFGCWTLYGQAQTYSSLGLMGTVTITTVLSLGCYAVARHSLQTNYAQLPSKQPLLVESASTGSSSSGDPSLSSPGHKYDFGCPMEGRLMIISLYAVATNILTMSCDIYMMQAGNDYSGLLTQLKFADITLSYGMGVVTFVLFGLHPDLRKFYRQKIKGLISRWKRLTERSASSPRVSLTSSSSTTSFDAVQAPA